MTYIDQNGDSSTALLECPANISDDDRACAGSDKSTITEAEIEAILATLVNPDAEKEHYYEYPDEILMEILGAIIRCPDFLPQVVDSIEPTYFRERAHQVICRIILKHWKQYGATPTKEIIRQQLRIELRDNKTLPIYEAELKAVYNAGEPGFHSAQYWIDQIIEFGRVQRCRTGVHKMIDTLTRPPRNADKWATVEQIMSEALKRPIAPSEPKQRVFAGDEMANLQPPEWLVQEHLSEKGFGVLIGESGAGKSFIAVDYALCVASGRAYLDQYDVSQGPVFLIGAEGASGIRWRKRAWELHHKCEPVKEFFHVPEDFDLRKESQAQELIGLIRAALAKHVPDTTGPKLIVLDTLFNMLSGGDENSPADMGGLLATVKLLQNEFDCAVLALHHPGHQDKERPRGHSSLRPACDSVILVQGDPRHGMTITNTKQKDFEQFRSYKLLTKRVGPVAHDNKNQPIFSLVCDGKQDAYKFQYNKLKEKPRELLTAIQQRFGVDLFRHKDVVELAEKLEIPKATATDNLKVLVNIRFIVPVGEDDERRYRLNVDVYPQMLIAQ